MPKMSDTMEEGVLVAWLAEEGASVSAGDVIAQVETDKATMDLEVYDDGVLLKRVVGEGDSVPIGALIAVLGSEGESPDAILGQYGGDGASGSSEATEVAPVDAPEASGDGAATEVPPAPSSTDGGRVKASPLARRMAEEAGLDLASIAGSGPDGRVAKRDIEAAQAGGTSSSPTPVEVPAAAPTPAPAPAPSSAVAPVAATTDVSQDLRITQMRKDRKSVV